MSLEYLGNYVGIWERGPVFPGVIKSYMVEFIIVHDMVEVRVFFNLLLTVEGVDVHESQ